MDSKRRATILVGAVAVLFAVIVIVVVVVLVAGAARPRGVAVATGATSASPSPEPTLLSHGTAAQNLAYFDLVNRRLIAAGGNLDGRAFIDNLVAAGFTKSRMELTPDTTSIGLKADNIEFSVRIGSSCLIGEYGVVGYASTVQPELGTGTCLVGNTRPIDW